LSDWVGGIRAAVTLVLLAGWTVLLLPVQMVAVLLHLPIARSVPALYHRGNCRLIGIDVRRTGAPLVDPPALYVCNHASYLDIVVLSTLLDASFVAKSEVAGWPLFGLLAKLVNTIFVDRRPSRSGAHRNEMRERLEAGRSLILFPEGTSSDGNRVLPFNSTFFAIVEEPIRGKPIPVQPISLAYTRYNNLPMSRRERPYLTWYGDTAMAGHLWRLLSIGRATVEVRFHPPVTIEPFGSRKALAAACEQTVVGGLSRLLSGRAERHDAAAAVPRRA
jgi:1-acyl-sn-glycerol-3-phosphate acyltransferase